MLSIRATSPLAAGTREVLALMHQIAGGQKIDYLLIGATARDMLLEHVFGITSLRATRDVDFALAVRDWAQFDEVRRELIQTGRFGALPGLAHRWHYHGKNAGPVPIDLIPFGGVERQGNQIAWPPDMDIVMSVAGYREALQASVSVDIGEGLVIPVASLPGLACLKLMAWKARRSLSKKDAEDLRFILAHYGDAGNNDRLYGPAYALMEAAGYELELAGAALLGFDARQLLDETTLGKIAGMLADPKLRACLEMDMKRAGVAHIIPSSDLLREFERGLSLNSLDA